MYCTAPIQHTDITSLASYDLHNFTNMIDGDTIEAWFSLVRQMKLDSATSYPTAVSTQQMKSASALVTNGIYSEEQAGLFAKEDTTIGPDQVIEFHEKREKRSNEITKGFFDNQHGPYTPPIPVFNDPNTLRADDELMQVTELTKNSSMSPPAHKKLLTK